MLISSFGEIVFCGIVRIGFLMGSFTCIFFMKTHRNFTIPLVACVVLVLSNRLCKVNELISLAVSIAPPNENIPPVLKTDL
jgi:hypothetical protein